jgi:glucose-1-phosphate thymidylyltransferase
MKGIILSGGAGSRLFPLTVVANKQLQAVYDKPMIYYPLTTLIECGITDICLITTKGDSKLFNRLLGDGSRFGVTIDYRVQDKPRGIAEAFIIAKSFIKKDNVALILGDNIYSPGCRFLSDSDKANWSGARVFGYEVDNPSIYGVVEFDRSRRVVGLEEKPEDPKSNYAVPGFYLYDNKVVRIAENLQPSGRGELEITDVNREYLHREQLQVKLLPRGSVWLDAGSSSSLHEAAAYIHAVEKRQGIKIGCPEEMAYRKKLVDKAHLQSIINSMPVSEYRSYLEKIV